MRMAAVSFAGRRRRQLHDLRTTATPAPTRHSGSHGEQKSAALEVIDRIVKAPAAGVAQREGPLDASMLCRALSMPRQKRITSQGCAKVATLRSKGRKLT